MPCPCRSDVAPITKADEADMVAADLDEAAEMAALGAKGPFGEAGFSTLARRHVGLPQNLHSALVCPTRWLLLVVHPQ